MGILVTRHTSSKRALIPKKIYASDGSVNSCSRNIHVRKQFFRISRSHVSLQFYAVNCRLRLFHLISAIWKNRTEIDKFFTQKITFPLVSSKFCSQSITNQNHVTKLELFLIQYNSQQAQFEPINCFLNEFTDLGS